jgi:hypothetical protein|tara:strand:- start:280 stop:474 length:195 start_codon:yes stop_codon:yes gene_type:complete
MKKKTAKLYNNNDCFNLEEVQEKDKKLVPKDVFEGYIPPKGKKDTKKKKAKKKAKIPKKGKVPY